MSIRNSGWLDWTTHKPGIFAKTYTQPNTGLLGLALHSWVGSEAETADGIPNRFLSEEKDINGNFTPSAAASTMFVLRYSGELIQMYPVTASTWTSGGREANTQTWAVEAEGGYLAAPGGYSEPLRQEQVATMIRLAEEWEEYSGRSCVRGETMWEHNELSKKFATPPTACPAHRYDNFYAAWSAMHVPRAGLTDAERIARLERLMAGNGFGRNPDRSIALLGEAAMVAADADGGSVYLALAELQHQLAQHKIGHGG